MKPAFGSLRWALSKGRSNDADHETVRQTGRGYHAVYREHEVNHCPGCGRTHWMIGRMSAECAFCATALPLAEASMRSHNGPAIIQHKNRHHDAAWAA